MTMAPSTSAQNILYSPGPNKKPKSKAILKHPSEAQASLSHKPNPDAQQHPSISASGVNISTVRLHTATFAFDLPTTDAFFQEKGLETHIHVFYLAKS